METAHSAEPGRNSRAARSAPLTLTLPERLTADETAELVEWFGRCPSLSPAVLDAIVCRLSKECLDERAAARYLGGSRPLSARTMQAWRLSGAGPKFIKIGDGPRAPVRYLISDLLEWSGRRCQRSTSDRNGGAE